MTSLTRPAADTAEAGAGPHRAVVARRRRLPGLPALLRRLDGDGVGDLEGLRPRLDHLRRARRRRALAQPLLPLAAARPRVRRRRLLRHRAGVRRPGRRSTRLLADAHAPGPAAADGHRPEPLLERAPLVPGRAGRRTGLARAGRFLFRDGRGPDGASRPTTGGRSSAARPGPASSRPTDARPVVPAPLRRRASPTSTGATPRSATCSRRAAVLVRPWRRRLPHRRRARSGEGRRDCPTRPARRRTRPGPPDPMWDQPGVHDIFRRWRRDGRGYDRDLTLVGEVWVSTPRSSPATCARTSCPGVLLRPARPAVAGAGLPRRRSPRPGRARPPAADRSPGRWTTTTCTARDPVRPRPAPVAVPARGPGDGAPRGPVDLGPGQPTRGPRRCSSLALPGVVYLYQGEELGLPEVLDLPDEARQDPIFGRGRRHRPRPRRLPGPAALALRRSRLRVLAAGQRRGCRSPTGSPSSPVDRRAGRPGLHVQPVPALPRAAQRSVVRARRAAAVAPTPGRDDVLLFAPAAGPPASRYVARPYEPPAQWGEAGAGQWPSGGPLAARAIGRMADAGCADQQLDPTALGWRPGTVLVTHRDLRTSRCRAVSPEPNDATRSWPARADAARRS